MNTSKKTAVIIFVGLFLGTMFTSVAQIGHGGLPYSFKKNATVSQLNVEWLPYSDNNLLLEAEIAVPSKQDGFVFGKEIEVDYNLKNSGLWETLPDGGRLWRLGIESTGAYSLNLLFDKFNIPPHSHLFIYTEDKSFIMGKFTEANNNQWGNFATSLLPSDAIVLEYYESLQDYDKGIIQVSTVVHGYKDFLFRKSSYGTSKAKCHIDANCEEGNKYPNAKRSVAVILSGGHGYCSGALINNTAHDGKPYFLTANHCLSSNLSQYVFVFNHESTGCNENTEKPTTETSINGATLLASHSHSDFALLLLNDKPTQDFNAYYAGWDRRNLAVAGAFGFHHPLGDMKKISINNKLLDSSKWDETDVSYPDNTHWKVTSWDKGSTEGGSSGSPLFNSLEQIIGQLEGGTAECKGNNPTGLDLYGKFYYSWANGGNNQKKDARLDYWLDSIKTGEQTILGYDPYKGSKSTNVTDKELKENRITISISPNPASDKVKIAANIQLFSYKIYTISGQCVRSETINSWSLDVNVNGLPEGIFIMEILTENGVVHKKLCVQR